MPKKRDVASLVGNFSPVKRRRAILVKSIRHRRGEIGEELNRRAKVVSDGSTQVQNVIPSWKTDVLSTFTIA